MLKKHLGFAFNIVALGLFFPGILLTMFSFSMEMAATVSGSNLNTALIDKELSIMATIRELWEDQRLLVAALIFAFSVCIPLLKTLMVCLAYFTKSLQVEKRLINFVGAIGKWSMADVFVIAIFLAIMSTNHAETANSEEFSVFGFKIGLDISTQTLSAAGDGFYFFTAYCILSLIGTQLASSALKSAIKHSIKESPEV